MDVKEQLDKAVESGNPNRILVEIANWLTEHVENETGPRAYFVKQAAKNLKEASSC